MFMPMSFSKKTAHSGAFFSAFHQQVSNSLAYLQIDCIVSRLSTPDYPSPNRSEVHTHGYCSLNDYLSEEQIQMGDETK